MRQVGHRESDAILGAMRQVALAGGHALTCADTTSVRAAGRYLLPDPAPELDAWIAAAVAQGSGTAIEVEGKWAALELSGPDAARLLSASLDVAAVLESRDCAAVVLFDCPAVLAAAATGYRVYVKASYIADFLTAIERLRASLGVG